MRTAIAALLIVLLTAGCGNPNPYFGTPDILHPGSLAYQRWRAEMFDPYPVPYLGTPVEGGRPPQYRTPVPQVQDNIKNPNGLIFRNGPPPAKDDLAPIL